MFIVFTNFAWPGRYRASKVTCQLVTPPPFRERRRLQWPTGVRRWLSRGSAVAPVRRPRSRWLGCEVLKDATKLTLASLEPLPFSLALSMPKRTHRATIAAACFSAAVHTRHRTTGRFTTSTAPPPPHAPCRPSIWSNRARVRAHCRLLTMRSSPAHRHPHGPPRPVLLSALSAHLTLVPPSPSLVDAAVMTLPGNVLPSRRNTAAPRHDMAATYARMRPHSSAPFQSSLVASLGLPRLQGADAPLGWPSSSRSSLEHHCVPSPSRRRHGHRS
jgi:hypothetical protein